MPDKYSENIVKRFTYWTVYAHTNQGYLGRCVVWCQRATALDLTDATREELAELHEILPAVKRTIEKSFGADWMNYSFLGNETRHLHGHVVPRYTGPQEFEGRVFSDPEWGGNWRTNKSFETSKEILQAIKKKLQDNWE